MLKREKPKSERKFSSKFNSKIIYIIALIISIFLLVLYMVQVDMIVEDSINQTTKETKCYSNLDCVPAQCCHPTSCIAKQYAPTCEGIMCTMECREGTMDCGGGSCGCVDNKCVIV